MIVTVVEHEWPWHCKNLLCEVPLYLTQSIAAGKCCCCRGACNEPDTRVDGLPVSPGAILNQAVSA